MPIKKIAITGIFLLAGFCINGFSETKIGIFRYGAGAAGMYDALKKEGTLAVTILEDIDEKELFKYDAVIIGSMKGIPAGKNWRYALITYVRAGGGLMLNHDTVGYRGWDDDPLFPEIARGVDRSETHILTVLEDTESLTTGLPDQFSHAYYDHIVLEKGPAGKIIVTEKNGKPVVIAGKQGNGKVVANGMVTGFGIPGVRVEEERSPEGDEKKFLANVVQWLSSERISALDKSILNSRLNEIRPIVQSEKNKRTPRIQENSTSWYSPDTVYSLGFTPKPVCELEGKVFLFVTYWEQNRSFYSYTKLKTALEEYRRMGVTDICIEQKEGSTVAHSTKVAGVSEHWYTGKFKSLGMDPLETFLKASKEVGLDIWIIDHIGPVSNLEWAAKNSQGKPYAYGSWKTIEDVLSPEWLRTQEAVYKEYSEYKKKYPNFQGIYYDELRFNMVDFHEDDIGRIEKFCYDKFGEPPPKGYYQKKLASGRNWIDASDKWWRRYVLFKQKVNTEYERSLTEICRKYGLKRILEVPYGVDRDGWMKGVDSDALKDIDADYYFTSRSSPYLFFPRFMTGAHEWSRWGYTFTHCLTGRDEFAFSSLCIRKPMMHANPRAVDCYSYHFRNTKEWHGANPPSKTAVVFSPYSTAIFQSADMSLIQHQRNLEKCIQRYRDTTAIPIAATEHYKNFDVLIGSFDSFRYLSPDILMALNKFAEEGGTIISLGGRFSTARQDLTEENDSTAFFTGMKTTGKRVFTESVQVDDTKILFPPREIYSVEVVDEMTHIMAVFPENHSPAITERQVGKGQVITILVDPTENETLGKLLVQTVNRFSAPLVTIESSLSIVKVLTKNGAVAIGLYDNQDDLKKTPQYPAKVNLKVDMKDASTNKFRVIISNLDKQQELPPPGDYWGESFWTKEQLKNGITFAVPKNNLLSLQLPDDSGLGESVFDKADMQRFENNLRTRWSKQTFLRSYEHAIVIIKPTD